MSTSRYTNVRERPVRIGAHGLPTCRWCKGPVEPPRRTFCSENCVHEYSLRSNGQYLRAHVYMRDKGICALCGRDTTALRKELSALSWEERKKRCEELGIPESRGFCDSLWDADHIKPVCEGGGQSGLDNIQTVCLPCHYAKSTQDGERRRRKRA